MVKRDIFDDITAVIKSEAIAGQLSVDPQVLREFFTPVKQPTSSATKRQTTQPSQNSQTQAFNQPQRINRQQISQPQQIAATTVKIPDSLKNNSLNELEAKTKVCTLCGLSAKRHNGVFGEGNPQAELMFIGSHPNEFEDKNGRPFYGKTGETLNKMITAMKYRREDVYLCNVAKCATVRLQESEAKACLPYLIEQIKRVNPKVIVLLGPVPLKLLFDKIGLSKLRGNWLTLGTIKVMPTFHPNYLDRYPEHKKDTWNDLKQVMKFLGKM